LRGTTGKELIARAIHDNSKRHKGPMIRVNCAAIPEGLMESEFFGHEKGAFTGATQKREGRFALAHGGTIFLDEVAELPPNLQAKLLRVLQEGELEPVGSTTTKHVDVRVIAATNRDLKAEVAAGRFRGGLYFRLNTHRFISHLPGMRIPRSFGAFPARDDMVRYPEDYETFLEVPIHRSVRVKRIDPVKHGWRLTASDGIWMARNVIIATGHERVPVIIRQPVGVASH
jgi:sigma54-dependent transcription regulator